MFVYQPIFNALESKEVKGTEQIIVSEWKNYSSNCSSKKLYPLYNGSLPKIKRFGYKLGIQSISLL